jgi:tight adherence protein C
VTVALAAVAGGLLAVALAELAATWRRPSGPPGGRGRALARLLGALGRRAGLRLQPGDIGARLAAAGAPPGIGVADVLAVKAGGAVAGVLLALPLAAAAPGRLAPVVLLAAPGAGFLAPDVALARRARRRAAVLAREVADVLDLLRVAVQAGLDTGRALGEVGRRRGGLLGGELRRTARELELGVPRARALARLSARCPLPEIAALTAAIGRADRHGAPLAPALEGLAAEARGEHGRRLRDEAARAAPQIQLVVALLLVPAVMLLVAAALVQALVPEG